MELLEMYLKRRSLKTSLKTWLLHRYFLMKCIFICCQKQIWRISFCGCFCNVYSHFDGQSMRPLNYYVRLKLPFFGPPSFLVHKCSQRTDAPPPVDACIFEKEVTPSPHPQNNLQNNCIITNYKIILYFITK